jgi:hypothetical protein
MLASLLHSCGPGLRLVEHLDHGGDIVYRHACKLGCEGICGLPAPPQQKQPTRNNSDATRP